jgi:hypothetical protein
VHWQWFMKTDDMLTTLWVCKYVLKLSYKLNCRTPEENACMVKYPDVQKHL